MSKHAQYNKSTTKFKSANPIFEEWITEWRDEAVARDLQSKHTYTKCLYSLKKYPLPLNSGKECLILEGFGDKICKLIDEKLAQFLNEGGVLHEEEDDLEILSDNDNNSIEIEKQPQVTIQNNDSEDDQALAEIEIQHSQGNSSKYPNLLLNINPSKKTKSKSKNEEDSIDQGEKAKKKQKSSRSKEYIPEFRSGAYALLITLLKTEESDPDESTNYMLKSQLLKEAQKHCDAQFVSNDPRNHYSAWNAMSNLIKKDLAIKENKLPARYRLTESGRELARKLLYGISSETENKNDSDSDSDACVSAKKISKLNSNEPIKKSTKTNVSSPVKNPIVSKSSDDCIEIIDSDSQDSDILPIVEKIKPTNVKKKVLSNKEDDLPDIYMFKNRYDNSSDSDNGLEDISKPMAKSDNHTGLSQQFTNSTISSTKFQSYNSFESNELSTRLIDKPTVLTTLQPGSFDIILFVDNCEQSHAKRQDLLIDELKKSNIKFETGKLHVGDFAWIARSKNGSTILNSDLILDYIVERKRMDDLCQSIIDGRYKEQKFRLKKSGITKAIYLIEEYGSIKHMSLPEKSLVQADVNTQLIDHLIVHHTTDPKDSAYYLIQMTKYLTEKFKNVKLNACLKKDLDEYNKKQSQSKSKEQSLIYLMTFKEFNEFSNKNKPLTIKEMFAKCLMKIQGVSQEKCLAIIEHFETPSKMIKELGKLSDETSRTKMLANIKYGSQQRNVGPAIAKIIVQLFYTNGPLN